MSLIDLIMYAIDRIKGADEADALAMRRGREAARRARLSAARARRAAK